jgi:polysaccharide export outer membrane protein
LDVFVEGVPELSRDYRVGGDGVITLPMLSRPIMAEGRTLEQLSEAIGKDLLEAGLLTDPQVVVTMKSSPWNTVVVSGAAKKPGVYPVFGHMTMLQLLTLAEGLTDDAGNTAIVTRGQNAPEGPGPITGQAVENATVENAKAVTSHTFKVKVWQLWQDGDASLDVNLYPGDRVLVKRADIVYIVGAVNRPGGYVLNDLEPMTLITAMAVSLGYSSLAKTSKAVIMRKNPHTPGGRELIPVDLKKVFSLHAPDRQLFANDILFVPESGAKRQLNNVTGNLAQALVYSSVYRVAY